MKGAAVSIGALGVCGATPGGKKVEFGEVRGEGLEARALRRSPPSPRPSPRGGERETSVARRGVGGAGAESGNEVRNLESICDECCGLSAIGVEGQLGGMGK